MSGNESSKKNICVCDTFYQTIQNYKTSYAIKQNGENNLPI